MIDGRVATNIWNAELICKIVTKLDIGTPPEILHSDEKDLLQCFLSDVVHVQTIDTPPTLPGEGDEDEDVMFDASFSLESAEPPEKQSEGLCHFLDYVDGNRFNDELQEAMELIEFQSSAGTAGFDCTGGETMGDFMVFHLSFVAVAEFFEDHRFPINKKMYREYLYDEWRT